MHCCTKLRAALGAKGRLLQKSSIHGRAVPAEMAAWQIHRYGGVEELELTTSRRVPAITCPTEVLIHVHAASVNPIDVAMLGGYGSTTVNVLRQLGGTLEFPLTLGRDLSGEVVAVGGRVGQFRPGDLVWAALGPQRQGSHAEYVTAAAGSVSLKPRSVSHVEAASLPYAAATAWSALVVTAELCSEASRRGRRVLVLGASGGVGSFAVQLLKTWGCEVTATCATDAVPLVESLGADVVVDYTSDQAEQHLTLMQGYDVILDCSGRSSERWLPLLKPWRYSKYVTLSPPLLRNVDESGLLAGAVRNGLQLVKNNIASHSGGSSFRWAFFMPNGCALNQVKDLVDDGKIRPVISTRWRLRTCLLRSPRWLQVTAEARQCCPWFQIHLPSTSLAVTTKENCKRSAERWRIRCVMLTDGLHHCCVCQKCCLGTEGRFFQRWHGSVKLFLFVMVVVLVRFPMPFWSTASTYLV